MTPHDRHTIFRIWNYFGDHTTPSSRKHISHGAPKPATRCLGGKFFYWFLLLAFESRGWSESLIVGSFVITDPLLALQCRYPLPLSPLGGPREMVMFAFAVLLWRPKELVSCRTDSLSPSVLRQPPVVALGFVVT